MIHLPESTLIDDLTIMVYSKKGDSQKELKIIKFFNMKLFLINI